MIENLGIPPVIPEEDSKLFGGILILISSWGVAGNLVMMILLVLSGVGNVTNRLLFFLSMVDFLQAVLCILPMGVSGMVLRWPFGDILCEAYLSIQDSCQMTVSYIMLLICLNKVYSIRWSLHYTTHRQSLARATLWICWAIFVFPYLVFEPAVIVFRHHHNYTKAVYHPDLLTCVDEYWLSDEYDLGFLLFTIFKWICLFILPYLTSIAAYTYLLYLVQTLRNQKQKSRSASNPSPSCKNVTNSVSSLTTVESNKAILQLPDYNSASSYHTMAVWDKAEKATSWILSIIVLLYIISLLPKAFLLLHHLISPDNVLQGRIFYNLVQYLGLLANPVLYTLQYPSIKEQLQQIGHKSLY